jgi:hypothetical protein
MIRIFMTVSSAADMFANYNPRLPQLFLRSRSLRRAVAQSSLGALIDQTRQQLCQL